MAEPKYFILPPPMWSSKDKEIYQLMTFQKTEEVCKKEQYFNNFNLPIDNRVRKGICLKDVSIQEIDAKRYRIKCNEENLSKFRVGDYIKIHSGIEYDHNSVEAIITKEGDNFYEILIYSGLLSYYLTNNIPVLIDYPFFKITGDIIRNALSVLEKNEKKNLILNIIHRRIKILKNIEEKRKLKNKNFYDGILKEGFITLDKYQKLAFIDSICSSPISLIQGPPGTGKTTVLAFLCNYLIAEGKNVLVTGFTHRSINNALKSIWESSENKENIIKISDELKTTEFTDIYSNIPVYKRFDQSPFYNKIKNGLIVGATPYEVMRDEFNRINFDYIIFDEASQLHVNLAIMGMLKGEKYVFFGDHKQMRPIILGNSENHQLYKKNYLISQYLKPFLNFMVALRSAFVIE